jgi:hypothetical protein
MTRKSTWTLEPWEGSTEYRDGVSVSTLGMNSLPILFTVLSVIHGSFYKGMSKTECWIRRIINWNAKAFSRHMKVFSPGSIPFTSHSTNCPLKTNAGTNKQAGCLFPNRPNVLTKIKQTGNWATNWISADEYHDQVSRVARKPRSVRPVIQVGNGWDCCVPQLVDNLVQTGDDQPKTF